MNLSTTRVFQGDCLDLIKEIPDASIDAVVSDPPYGYLKHRLDRAFDEDALFAEFKRILKPAGAIVLFGRGVPFFRWGVKLDALGFVTPKFARRTKRLPTCGQDSFFGHRGSSKLSGSM